MSFRNYELEGGDRSRLGAQVAAQRQRVIERLRSVRRVVTVMSGKGGVGKSHITAMLAKHLVKQVNQSVGVLDADLTSPTVARLLDAPGPLRITENGVEPAVGCGGVRVVSTDLLLEAGQPLRWREPAREHFVWRGALEAGTLREFLSDVVWGTLDLLLVDLPPGADGLDDLAALWPDAEESNQDPLSAIVVTIPSAESHRSVARTMQAALEVGIRLLGVVENMSGYHCAECADQRTLFPGDAGSQLAREFGVPLLARLPFTTGELAAPGDDGFRNLADACLGVSP
jgi:ATP-binding protein involved in chromosome partitioning